MSGFFLLSPFVENDQCCDNSRNPTGQGKQKNNEK